MAGKHRGQPSGPEYQLELQERRVNLSEQREERFQRAQDARQGSSGEAFPDPAGSPRR